MNTLGLVFSLLLILSYGFYASWDKHLSSAKLRKTFIGHEKANRKLLNKYQSEIYKSFRFKSNPHESGEIHTKNRSATTTPKKAKQKINKHCAKINLHPLIQDGAKAHPLLYETAAKLLRTFYGAQFLEKRMEYRLLDALLAAKETSCLEKIDLQDSELQRVYYKMLKGSKNAFPSLLDYIKIEPSFDKLCLAHAHPDLFSVFFGPKVAARLHEEIHKKNGSLPSRELIELICSEEHQWIEDEAIFDFFAMGRPTHKEYKKTLIAEDRDSEVTLRKNVYLKG